MKSSWRSLLLGGCFGRGFGASESRRKPRDCGDRAIRVEELSGLSPVLVFSFRFCFSFISPAGESRPITKTRNWQIFTKFSLLICINQLVTKKWGAERHSNRGNKKGYEVAKNGESVSFPFVDVGEKIIGILVRSAVHCVGDDLNMNWNGNSH